MRKLISRAIEKSMTELPKTLVVGPEKLVIEPSLFDDHKSPHDHVTVGQLTLFLVWIGATVLFIVRYRKREHAKDKLEHDKDRSVPLTVASSTDPEKGLDVQEGEEQKASNGSVLTLEDASPKSSVSKASTASLSSPFPHQLPSLDTFLQYVFIFGLIMSYFYICDYKKIVPILHKEYSRDIFLFLVFMLFVVACAFTAKPTADVILGREQTEEWKGWMQVMFVWYHYFSAGEWYNWIRIYIACYVWMTGFGNFSFFWVKKDFSLWRMLKMLFRLNFLVIFVCIVTKNEYILYYICAMHTYWFLSVYCFMRVLSSWNQDRYKMAAKFGVYAVCNALLFEIPGVISTVFRPFWFVFQYHDGKHDIMHEWEFRLGLDHWVCFVGMLCAYNYPYFEAILKHLEDNMGSVQEQYKKIAIRIGMISTAIVVLIIWYFTLMTKEKYDYNAVHPYTSFIPILAYIVIRNSFPVLRQYHVHMFAWLGKITLETYLCQLHIYLQSNAKDLLLYIPDSRLLNFSISTIVYLVASYMLFKITNNFSAYLIPKDMKLVLKYICIGLVITTSACALAFIFQHVLTV